MRVVPIISLGFSLLALFTLGCDTAPAPTGGTGGTSAVTAGTGGAPCGAGNLGEPIVNGGCTPQPMPDSATTLPGPYGLRAFCLGNRQYMLQVNEWNSTLTQNLTYGGGSHYFKVIQQDASSPTNSGPTGFPSMYIGANSGNKTLGSNMPKLVSSITSVPTTWNWKDNGATDSATNTYNATYDVWFSTSPAGEPTASTPTGGFLMVWLHKPSAAQPIGSVQTPGATIASIPGTWDVWIGRNGAVPCISYVRTDTNPAYSMSFDLNLFIQDAVKNHTGTITAAMYLTNIFSGFEIWTGGVGLETTSFCAGVN